jgi:hypothetical protein
MLSNQFSASDQASLSFALGDIPDRHPRHLTRRDEQSVPSQSLLEAFQRPV